MDIVNNRSWSGPRTLLTKEQAVEIYMIGQAIRDCGIDPIRESRSSQTAKRFQVSPKTIRDIWNRRTWRNETRHLWANNEKPMVRCPKYIGSTDRSTHCRKETESCLGNGCAHFPRLSTQSPPLPSGFATGNTTNPQTFEVSRANYFVQAPPCTPPPFMEGDHIDAAADTWEGPFGPFLPPASEYDADPFHADWLYW